MPVLMTFGDSNTHGTPPITDVGVYGRFDAATRWPRLAAAELQWELVEEGLPGRTAQFDDPIMGSHMNGQVGLKMALCSQGPIDILTIMLGTNDVKARFCALPETVTGGIASLLDIAQGADMQTRHGGFQILLICPPPVVEVGPIKAEFYGGATKSQSLAAHYAQLAQARGVGFFDAGTVIKVSMVDGVHYDAPSHSVLAQAVAGALRAMV